MLRVNVIFIVDNTQRRTPLTMNVIRVDYLQRNKALPLSKQMTE